MVWENNTPWTHLFEKNSNFFLSKVSIWFGIDVDFCRQLVWHAVSIFFHFSNIKKRYCIHYYYIYPQIHFAPSFMRTRIVFFFLKTCIKQEKKTVNRIYYYFRRLFILIQYPSEWISLGMLNNFSIKIRKKRPSISASAMCHFCELHNGNSNGEEEINPLNISYTQSYYYSRLHKID